MDFTRIPSRAGEGAEGEGSWVRVGDWTRPVGAPETLVLSRKCMMLLESYNCDSNVSPDRDTTCDSLKGMHIFFYSFLVLSSPICEPFFEDADIPSLIITSS